MIEPGAAIGVVGGGQLGRYFALAARRHGYLPWVLDPDPHAPAMQVAAERIVAAYDDVPALERLGSACRAVTIEFENVAAAALERLERLTRVVPSARTVSVAQDRTEEKRAASRAGLQPVPHASVRTADDLAAAAAVTGFPAVLKTARLGYDGLGQCVCTAAQDLLPAWDRLGRAVCVLERRITLAAELSIVLARDDTGAISRLPPVANVHRRSILARSTVPSGLDESIERQAMEQAETLARALDYTGILAVEFFVADDGRLWFNEMAPRPHNSGHFSLDACDVSQFDLQLRTLCALPLTECRLLTPVVMVNLLGEVWENGSPRFDAVCAQPGASLHLYGKTAVRAGRKMGHVNCLGSDPAGAGAGANAVEALLGID